MGRDFEQRSRDLLIIDQQDGQVISLTHVLCQKSASSRPACPHHHSHGSGTHWHGGTAEPHRSGTDHADCKLPLEGKGKIGGAEWTLLGVYKSLIAQHLSHDHPNQADHLCRTTTNHSDQPLVLLPDQEDLQPTQTHMNVFILEQLHIQAKKWEYAYLMQSLLDAS